MKLSRTVRIVLALILIAILLVILWHYQYRNQEGLTNSNILKNFYSITSGSPPVETYVGDYTILTFKTSCTFTLPSNIQSLQIGYVVVGGGSGCNYDEYGVTGGGGGGICYTPLAQSTTKIQSDTSYNIQVGNGGLNPIQAGVYNEKNGATDKNKMIKIYGSQSSISGSNINPAIIANGGYMTSMFGGYPAPSLTKPSGGIFNLSGGVGDTLDNVGKVVSGKWTNTPAAVNGFKNGPLISIPEINLKQNFGGGGGGGSGSNLPANFIGSDGGVGGGGTGNYTITDQTKIDGQPNSGGGGGGYSKDNTDSKGFWLSTTRGWGSGGSGVVIIYFMSPIASVDKAFTVGSKVADEGGKFYLDSTTEVRYGYDNRWNYKTLAKGNYTANNDLFGDPAPGAGKIVQIISRENEIDKAAADKAASDKAASVALAQQEQKLEDALQEKKIIVAPTYSIPISEAFGLYK